MNTNWKLTALAALLPCITAEICQPYEVGVGLQQQCTVYGGMNTACGSIDGTIFTNNCDDIDVTGFDATSGQYCNQPYLSGSSVECDDDGVPTKVGTSGGDFGNCYKYEGTQECGGFEYYRSIYYCCSRL